MSESAWSSFRTELDAWAECARIASLWLRDDDATETTRPLERLLELTGRYGVPVSLAVVPAGCTPALSRCLRVREGLQVLQHGYAHVNHAPAGEKKSEYGDHRPAGEMLGEIVRGKTVLTGLFPEQFLPVLVPPWNRIGEQVTTALPAEGFAGLSTYQPRRRREPVPGLVESNCHADLIDWRGSRSFIGAEVVLEQITGHLRARREERVEDEVTGLLTHHLDHDEGSWSFLERLLETSGAHPAARWLPVPEIPWSA